MAQRAHSKNTPAKKNTSKKPSKTKASTSFSLWKDGRIKKIVGLLFLLFSFFLAIALGSYLYTWQQDQDKVFHAGNALDFLLHNREILLNKAGRLGAFLSHQLIFNGFGLPSFIFVLLFGIWGLNLLLSHRIYSSLKTIFYSILFILILSPVLAYIFPSNRLSISSGGAMGEKIIRYLDQLAGPIGTLCIIIGLGLIALIIFFNPILRLPFWHSLTESKSDQVDENAVPPALSGKEHSARLSIDDRFPDPLQHAVEEVVIQEMPVDIQENFWETEAPSAEPTAEIALDLNQTTTRNEQKDGNQEVQLELVKHETAHSNIKDAHISIGSDEPYDPSLELRNYKFPTIDLLDQHSTDEISIDKNE